MENGQQSGKKLHLNEERQTVLSPTPPYPKNMLMEITNACNHNCVFCGYHEQKRKKQFADKDLMFRIMDEAYDLGTREIGFYMIGEPFLNPELPLYVEHAKKTGFEYIYITTNGALAEKEKVRDLLEKGLNSIKISCNAATRETYLKIHRKDDFDKVSENIKQIAELKQDYDFGFFISFIRCNWNESETELLHTLFGEYVDDIYLFDCSVQGGDWYFDDLLEKNIVSSFKGMQYPCVQVFNRFNITVQGYLDACCVDINNNLAIADLSKVSLKQAWSCDTFVDFRKKHINGIKELNGTMCYNCMTATNKQFKSIGGIAISGGKQSGK